MLCKKCNQDKSLELMRSDSSKKSGYKNCCKECDAIDSKNRYHNTSDKFKYVEKSKRYRDKNIELCRERDRTKRETLIKQEGENFYVRKRKSISKHYENNKDYYLERNKKRRALKANSNGSHTKEQREALYKRQNNRCNICLKENTLTMDHIIPLSRNGSNDISNIQGLCSFCNTSKGKKLMKEYLSQKDYNFWIIRNIEIHRTDL